MMPTNDPSPPSSVTLPAELVAEICETLDALRRSPDDSHVAARAQRIGIDLRLRLSSHDEDEPDISTLTLSEQQELFARVEAITAERERRCAAEAQTLRLAALMHNVRHLLVRCPQGNAPPRPHEQDRIDALRWLPEIEAALADLPQPKSRTSGCGGMVERFYDDQ